MTLPRAQALQDDYAFNAWLIHRHVDGISDEASLLQLPFEANCLNWILGHIVWRRNSVLSTLGLPTLWDDAIVLKYKTDSQPIRSQAGARPFSLLLTDLDQTQQSISASLQEATDANLDKVVVNDRGSKPVIEHLRGFHWHETYHIGQLDILRAYVVSQS
jgi:hypothetical protein